jgi:hypothetical protein
MVQIQTVDVDTVMIKPVRAIIRVFERRLKVLDNILCTSGMASRVFKLVGRSTLTTIYTQSKGRGYAVQGQSRAKGDLVPASNDGMH